MHLKCICVNGSYGGMPPFCPGNTKRKSEKSLDLSPKIIIIVLMRIFQFSRLFFHRCHLNENVWLISHLIGTVWPFRVRWVVFFSLVKCHVSLGSFLLFITDTTESSTTTKALEDEIWCFKLKPCVAHCVDMCVRNKHTTNKHKMIHVWEKIPDRTEPFLVGLSLFGPMQASCCCWVDYKARSIYHQRVNKTGNELI